MSASKQNRSRRNKQILEEYMELYFREMLREEFVFEQLAKKYFLQPRTIYLIILEQQLATQQPELPLHGDQEI